MTYEPDDELFGHPCFGCKKHWYADRDTCCYQMCEKLAEWKAKKKDQEKEANIGRAS